MSKSTARISDQLGKDPDTFPILNADYSETITIEDRPSIIEHKTKGNGWIVGSATNGIVGTNTGTIGGGQQVVGPGYTGVVDTIVQNKDNLYLERFDYDIFEDDSSTATGWGTGTLSFTVGQVALSTSVYKDTAIISSATLTIDDATNLTLELSADGGSNWETVTNGVEHTFTDTGNDLRFRFTASGNATVTVARINYG